MLKSKKDNSETPAFPELERQRAKLGEVFSQLREVDAKLEAALAEKREHEAQADSILARAELILEGGEALPERDISAEVRILQERREILRKAVELQQGRVDELAREASSAEYRRLKPAYVAELKKLVSAVENCQAALDGMASIRRSMTERGLRDVFPAIAWPGMKPGDLSRQREAFHYKLELSGLGEALK